MQHQRIKTIIISQREDDQYKRKQSTKRETWTMSRDIFHTPIRLIHVLLLLLFFFSVHVSFDAIFSCCKWHIKLYDLWLYVLFALLHRSQMNKKKHNEYVRAPRVYHLRLKFIVSLSVVYLYNNVQLQYVLETTEFGVECVCWMHFKRVFMFLFDTF